MSVIGLLIRREFVERVRQRSFIVATLFSVVGIILLALIPAMISSFATTTASKVAVAAPDLALAKSLAAALDKASDKSEVLAYKPTGPDLPPAIRARIDDGTFDAALIAYRDLTHHVGIAYYPKASTALQSADDLRTALQQAVLLADVGPDQQTGVRQALDFPWTVHSLNSRYKNANDQFFSVAIVYFLLIMLYIAVIVYGSQVGSGVIEEKANRIMEIMIGAVRPSQLLAGKVFGISAVALLQLTINAIAAAAAAVLAGVLYGESAQGAQAIAAANASPQAQEMTARIVSQGLPHIPWAELAFLIVFFFLGFFSYASLYAGIGSLLSKADEVQQYSSIFILPIVAAYILAIFALQFPNMPIVVWGSMIPLFSPMLMFTRICTTDVPPWQIAVSIAASGLAIWGLTILAGKLYRVGVLMYGKPPKPSEIWRALRART